MYSRLQQALIKLHCTYNVIQGFIREIPLTSLTSQSSHHIHLTHHQTATALVCHDILCRYSIDIFLSIFDLWSHLNYSPSSCDWGLRWSVKTDAGIVTLTTVSVTERCLHTLAPAPQQQLPSPDLAPAPVTTERKPALTLGCSHNHYTTTPLQSHAGITPRREQSTNRLFNKSSYFRVKLKRIKFELYTEPDLDQTWPGPYLTWAWQ